MKSLNSLSIVVSVFNEEASLVSFWKEVKSILGENKAINFEIIFVNDGSLDQSQEIINSIISDPSNSGYEFISIDFSKNFGHESAMIAGVDVASKDATICIDSDLQHPPKLIPLMIEKYNEGSEIVTMVRTKRMDNGVFKNSTSKLFYRFLNSLSDYNFDRNASDFFLISNRVSSILKDNFRERNRFLRGYIQTIGFAKTSIEFEAPARMEGETSYSFLKLMKLSFVALFSFSNKPLQISLVISLIFALFTATFMGFSLYVYFFGNKPPSGYTTLIIFQGICFTILFLLIGILSIYFGKTIDEMRKRPIYLIKNLKKTNVKESDN